MKMSDPKIKDATPVELAAMSRDLRQEMFNLRLQQASSQLEKPARLRHAAPGHRAGRNPHFTTPQQSGIDLNLYG